MNIAETILAAGLDHAPAVLYRGSTVTYAQLRQEVALVVGQLGRRAIKLQSRVGLFSENSPFFIATYLGIMRAGLVVVPFQTEVSQDTFTKIIADAQIQQIFLSKRAATRVRPWAEALGLQILVEGDSWADGDNGDNSDASITQAPGSSDPTRELTEETSRSSTLACLLFTSGSTGAPKGVMLTHRNIECNTRDIVSYMGLSSADRVMVVLPFHYCFGLSLLHTHLFCGGSVVLNNDFRLYPETVLKDMQEKECTGFAGVPSTYQLLLRKSRFRQMGFPKLRWFQQAGGKLPNACIAEIRTSFPQVNYFLMYGQTEATARLSYLPPEQLAEKLGSIGKGLQSTQLEVVKRDGTPVQRGSEEIGEIIAYGDNIALGYWNDAEETAKFFKDGKLHTGDLARVDQDGFIFIVERERDMIKSGGNRVSSKEVEDVIAEIPSVVEVAVIGVPHELLGESIKAYVVLHPSATLQQNDILLHCRKRLPAFKIPEAVALVRSLPHNSAGKVMKQALKNGNDHQVSGSGANSSQSDHKFAAPGAPVAEV